MALIWIAIRGVLSLVLPGISRRRNARRAAERGAIWVGLANFEAKQDQQVPVVAQALAGVDKLYGARFSPLGDTRPVGGLLSVFGDRVTWEPTTWLGRGEARGWELPRASIKSVDVVKMPLPVLGSRKSAIRTHEGDITMTVVDPEGFRAALDT